MNLCVLCKKEDPILGITAKAYPVGEKCFGKLIDASVSWTEDATLKQIRDGLRQGRHITGESPPSELTTVLKS